MDRIADDSKASDAPSAPSAPFAPSAPSGGAPVSEPHAGRQETAFDAVAFTGLESAVVSACGALTYLTMPLCCCGSLTLVNDYERVVHLRLGKVLHPIAGGGGVYVSYCCIDELHRIDMRELTLDIPRQTVVLADSLTVTVDGVVYYRVFDPNRAVFGVADRERAIHLLAQTKLREVLGMKTFEELQTNRTAIARELEAAVDPPSDGWGVDVTRIDLSDVVLPEDLTRAMASESEASRRARAKLIAAEGERKAAQTLAEAAEILSKNPNAMQLRFLQTLTAISAENNSTIVLPFPTDLLGGLRAAAAAQQLTDV